MTKIGKAETFLGGFSYFRKELSTLLCAKVLGEILLEAGCLCVLVTMLLF